MRLLRRLLSGVSRAAADRCPEGGHPAELGCKRRFDIFFLYKHFLLIDGIGG
jgi:hypothetical protein